MTSRDMHAEVIRTLEGVRTKIDGVEALAKENKERLRCITPQSTVQPVPRPKQGTQLARGASVTKYLRQYTHEKNAKIADGMPRYEEFSEDVSDKQYNTDAMNTLEWILGLHLGSNFGVLTWEQVCKTSPGKMGLIIRDAVDAPELKVFAQAAGQWAIQMLITSKINSRIRYHRDRRVQEESQQEEENLAPMTVPDLETDDFLPEISQRTEGERFQGEYRDMEHSNQDTDYPTASRSVHLGEPSSFFASSPHDEGLSRFSMRRTVQQRRASQNNPSTSANVMLQGNGVALPVSSNRTEHIRTARGVSWRVMRARGRGGRSSRAASNATPRGISRPTRARRASAIANRRGSRG